MGWSGSALASPASNADKPRAFSGIQVMRGVAACTVMVGHGLNGFFPILDRIFPAGVDVFFVISGFIISYSASNIDTRSRTSRAFRFAVHRIIRIFPLYWIVLTCALFTNSRMHFCSDHMTVATIFLDDPTSCFVTPAWTLCFEVQFYAFVAIAMLLVPRYIFPAIICFMIPMIVVHGFDLPINMVVTNPLVLEFGLGALIAYLAKHDIKGFGPAAAILSIAFFGAGAAIATGVGAGAVNGMERIATYGLGSALLIYAVMTADLRNVRFPRFAQYLGNASYSIYIWHLLLIIWWFAAFEPTLIVWIPGYLLIVLRLIFILAATILSYEYLERPMLRYMRRDGDRLTDAAMTWAGKIYRSLASVVPSTN